ncbi:branched-chain amino acid ABC transporter permease [Paraburkholderia sp. LEh10]|uniref:branched-chain amino acid ABC transporter permease n=1 Tax=Paraburkholderia sp. LEh10 TaxID=2821353 RepID=UPI001AE19ACF|nr:branched-chain amino acid ABC transporter permease [Paraburkholderia sp. LEh10]MBP0592270.1 branched-chain amino acid ABC transporter permease [Paraburkholderia sp. LEh10]
MPTIRGAHRLNSVPREASPAGRSWDAYLPPRPNRARRTFNWGAVLVVAVALPFLFTGPFAISVLTQICIAITFALAYNMLLGGTGLLSFGHALYFGIGAYATAHFLNAYGAAVPVVLVPVVGGVAALVVGAGVALFTVRSGKVIFAMISLAVGQLAFSAATIMTGFSGGDEGIRIDPTRAAGWGIDFGSPLNVYLLVAVWTWCAALAMYALTFTPLGRLMNATRDNPERMDFVGFNPVFIRGLALTLSAGFAGIAGSLYALGFQVVTLDTLSLTQSTVGLVHAYVGGYTSFFGPVLGALLFTLATAYLSPLTDAWPLYLGVFFVTVTISWRYGLTGGFMDLMRIAPNAWRQRGAAYVVRCTVPVVLGALATCAGFILLIEMIQSLNANMGTPLRLAFLPGSYSADPRTAMPWLVSIALLAAGFALLYLRRRAARQ